MTVDFLVDNQYGHYDFMTLSHSSESYRDAQLSLSACRKKFVGENKQKS